MMNTRKVPSRNIDLIGVVTDEMLAMFAERMKEIQEYDMALYEYNSKVKKEFKEPYETIRINLSTPGGSVMAGAGIMGIMDEAIAPIHIHVIGSCMSMGISILAHAETRSATKFSSFMIHGMSTGTYGYLDEGIQSLDYYKELEHELNVELTKRTNYTVEELESYSNVAHFFGYKEALEKGLLTKDIYDMTPPPRFSKSQFEEIVKSDLADGYTMDEVLDAFNSDNLQDNEIEIVLDLLAKYEEAFKANEEVEEEEVKEEAKVEEKEEEVKEEEVDAIEEKVFAQPCEMVTKEDSDEMNFEEFIDIFAPYYDALSYLFTGEYTFLEVATELQKLIEDLNNVDIELIMDFLEVIADVDEEDLNE